MVNLVLIRLARLIVRLTIRFKIQGREHVPAQGALLVISNHLSVADPVLIGAYFSRKVIFMAKEELFRSRFTGFFVRRFGAFPVYRGGSNLQTLRQSNRILEQGLVLGMFPEGKRSKVGCMIPAHAGSAMLAYHNRVNILPVAITGSESIRGFAWIWRRPQVNLTIGPTFKLPDYGRSLTKEQLAELTLILMQHIADMLPEKYRGAYGGEKMDNGQKNPDN